MARLCVAQRSELVSPKTNDALADDAGVTVVAQSENECLVSDTQLIVNAAGAAVAEADEKGWLDKIAQAYKDGIRKGIEVGRQQVIAEQEDAERSKLERESTLVNSLNEALKQIQAAREALAINYRAEVFEVVYEAVARIVTEDYALDSKRIDLMLAPMLDRISASRWAALVLAPVDFELLKNRGDLEGILALPSGVRLEVSDSVEPGGAILRTEAGELDLRLSTKLEQFKQLLLRHSGAA